MNHVVTVERVPTSGVPGSPPNQGMQATAYSLRLATLGSGFPPRLMPGVDMTSDVKSREQLFYVCLMFFLLGLSEEPEPGSPTVDPADIRGLAPTFLVSVGCLPHSRDERTCRPHNAAEGDTTPGLRLFR